MSSDIYKAIFDRKLKSFVDAFSEDGERIFKGGGKLIHPAEFGRYRENATKDLLSLVLKRDCAVSDGFLINSEGAVSTQCDIIIHNAEMQPIIADDIAKMFPVEEVRAFGEIKSKLSKDEFVKALQKMAQNKKMFDIISGAKGRQGFMGHAYSFLACNELDFDINKLNFDDVYVDFERKYWHNAILSVKNGAFCYRMSEPKSSSPQINALLHRNIPSYVWNALTGEVGYIVPQTNEITNFTPTLAFTEGEPIWHIEMFFGLVGMLIEHTKKRSHDPITYLGIEYNELKDNIF
jgi:hypothetical protein